MHLKFDPRVIDQLDKVLTQKINDLEELSKQLFLFRQLLLRINDNTVLYQNLIMYQDVIQNQINDLKNLKKSTYQIEEIYHRAESRVHDLIQSLPISNSVKKVTYVHNRQRILIHNEKLITDQSLLQLLWLDE